MSKMMSYKIRDYDADVLDVKSNEELVELMREVIAFIPAADDQTFMEELAEQVKMESGDDVRTDTKDNFVGDLLAIGFLKKVEDDKVDPTKA
jgi:hypothetical protein